MLVNAYANTANAKAKMEADMQAQVTATEKIKSIWTLISEWFSSWWEDIKTKVAGFIDKVATFVLSIYDGVVNAINWVGEKFTEAWNGIIGTLASIYNSLVDIAEAVGIDMDRWDFTELNYDKLKTSSELYEEAATKE
jgi:phage-related protein